MFTGNIDERLKKVLLIIGYMIILAGIVYAVVQLRGFFAFIFRLLAPFLIGLIIAYMFNPLLSFVQQKLKLSRIFALVIFYLIIGSGLAVILFLVVPVIYAQLVALFAAIKQVLPDKIQWLLTKLNIELNEDQLNKVKQQLEQLEIDLFALLKIAVPGAAAVAREGVSAAGLVVRGVARGVTSIFSIFSFIVFVVIINFYFLVDFHKIKPVIKTLVPERKEAQVFDLLKKIDVAVGGFIRGQLIDCALVGATTALLLFIFGFKKYALLIGVIAGIGNIIPYLGPILGATPAAIWVLLSAAYPTFMDKIYGLAIVAGIFIFVQALDGFVFQPRIVGKSAQLHPLAVMLALMVGASFGIPGMIIAIPVACIVRVLLKELWWEPLVARKKAQP